jgi:hypothetical protein
LNSFTAGIIAAITSIIATATSDGAQYPRGSDQPGFQTAALFVTLGMAVAGGVISGFLMWAATKLIRIDPGNFFNDRLFWNYPSDYENVVRGGGDDVEMRQPVAGRRREVMTSDARSV